MTTLLLALAAACTLFAAAAAHASVIMPPSRNAIDSEPGTPWSGDHKTNNPPTGWLMPYGSGCTNGTSECRSGQAAFWFSQGCGIGCEVCNGDAISGGGSLGGAMEQDAAALVLTIRAPM